MEICSVLFKFKAKTSLGQHVRIIGDHPQLGSWNPEKALVLSTSSEIYPFWIANEELRVPKGWQLGFLFVEVAIDFLIESTAAI